MPRKIASARKGSLGDGPVLPPEVIRRYSTPMGRRAAHMCEEALFELKLLAAGRDDAKRDVFAAHLSEDERLEQSAVLAAKAAALGEALQQGDFDDPFTGWPILMRCARELGPRYLAMVGNAPSDGPDAAQPREATAEARLPRLTVNGSTIGELFAAGAPAFAMGLVEEAGQLGGMFAMHLDGPLPHSLTGFRFGNALLGNDDCVVVQFIFEFYDFARYEVVVDACSSVVRAVLGKMLDTGECQFFVFDRDGQATAFKSDPRDGTVSGLRDNWPTIASATNSAAQFKQAESVFARRLATGGTLLNWVCRENVGNLDLSQDRLHLNP